jgi:oligoribonuclease NrnB/cAMP/cGMP phosphodiesterase (DHH superfamily)
MKGSRSLLRLSGVGMITVQQSACNVDDSPMKALQGSKSPLIVVHKNCNDGFGSAWVCRKAFDNPEFHHAYHGTQPPDVKGRDVLCIDFTYDRKDTEKMMEQAKSFTVIDHHVTAQKALIGLPNCYFDLNRSAMRLTYDLFCNWGLIDSKISMPPIVLYVEDRDLNRWQLPHTRQINAALTSYPMEFEDWDKFNHELESNFDDVIETGDGIMRFQDMLIDSIVEHAREVMLDDYCILSANTSLFWGEAAERLSHNRPFGLAWFRREDGKFVYSLRSDPAGVDVSKIASMHGGGGHCHMAGVCTDMPLV